MLDIIDKKKLANEIAMRFVTKKKAKKVKKPKKVKEKVEMPTYLINSDEAILSHDKPWMVVEARTLRGAKLLASHILSPNEELFVMKDGQIIASKLPGKKWKNL